jgi:oligoendopeptidase F
MDNSKVKTLPKRDEIDIKFKWVLEDIFQTNNIWEEDFNTVKALAKEIQSFKGTLGKESSNLLRCLKAQDKISSLAEKLFVYARMRRDEDNSNSVYQSLADRASALLTEVAASTSFIVPEILSISDKTLETFLNRDSGLALYKTFINELSRQKKHILSEREEEMLALTSDISHTAKDIFTMFNNADIKFPVIKDEYGNDIEVTKGRYIQLMESKDRKVRESAFKALYSSYEASRNTIAAMLLSNVKKNKFYSSIRKYKSTLEYALDDDNINTVVYDQLIETIHRNLPVLYRYLELRKKVLGVDELHMYDIYVPIIEQPKSNISYDEARKLVFDGLSPLGEEYTGFLKKGMESGWVDVFENQGKTSGAYSWGCYLSHPYVLLNYQGTTNDVFTLAHEMGHALHSFYTNNTQQYIYSEYKIFVAEVASTLNEALMTHYLLNNSTDKKEKAYLLNHHLEEFRGTIFRQVMFAEFEKIIHGKIENEEALTTDDLCSIYYDLNKQYFGDGVEIDKEIAIEWSRIPHFYNSFYVYKYATGFSAAIALSSQILKEGKPAVDRYINFLKSGNSDYPLELLRKAGVDLSTPEPTEAAMRHFEETLKELEELLK